MILGLTTARETYRPGQRVGSRLTDRHAPGERPESGMPTGPALARENVARQHNLAAERLHAEPLARRVASVPGRSACFFVRHD